MAKFDIGDTVRVVGYGNKFYVNKAEPQWKQWAESKHILDETDEILVIDINPEWVGGTGMVVEVNEESYALEKRSKEGMPHAWYNENQLELVNPDLFVKYGPEWEAELMKWRKKDLISLIKDLIKKQP